MPSMFRCRKCQSQEGLDYHQNLDPLPPRGKRGRKRRRPGHNLACRLRTDRDGVLLCLHDPLLVPATNNLSERDLRPLKLKQKISGSFRIKGGAQDFAILRSVLETARKQGWNALPDFDTFPLNEQLSISQIPIRWACSVLVLDLLSCCA